MLDTFATIVGRVKGRVPNASLLVAEDWVRNSFRRIAERRRWSWLIRFGQFVAPAQYNTGTANVTQGSIIVTGNGTTWTQGMVGEQFRTGINSPIYTIARFDSATQIELDYPWGPVTATNQGYRIYQCYFTPPADFHQFISVWDPNFAYQLRLDMHQEELNYIDPQRANTGQAYVVANLDYSLSYQGAVGATVQATGTGAIPVSGGAYTGPSDVVFTVQITTGGASGTAVYQWKEGSGAFTTGVVTSSIPVQLADGVQIQFPVGTYNLNDTFVIPCKAITAPGIPRYEIWPHQANAYVYPFLYEQRVQDLDDPGMVLPRFIRGDVLLEMSLSEAAKWPGPSVNEPNPYFNLSLSDRHERRAEQMIAELERQDDETYQLDAMYPMTTWPYAPVLGDAKWVQAHGI